MRAVNDQARPDAAASLGLRAGPTKPAPACPRRCPSRERYRSCAGGMWESDPAAGLALTDGQSQALRTACLAGTTRSRTRCPI